MVQDNPALETALRAGKLQFSRGKYQTLIVFPQVLKFSVIHYFPQGNDAELLQTVKRFLLVLK